MTINHRTDLLKLNAFLQLRTTHAARVSEYECHPAASVMAVNRLLLVLEDDGRDECILRNPAANQGFRLHAGHICLIPCNLEVGLDITPGLHFASLHFNLDLFYGFDVFGASQRCETRHSPALASEAEMALCEKDELRALCRINALIFQVCAAWMPPHTADLQRNLVASHRYESILAFVERAGDATTTVASLAAMLKMRSDVFSRTFTRDMGITPKELITKSLVRKASRMLHTPGVTARAVAERLGFSSQYYFSRFFKKHCGRSPKAYQNEAAPLYPTPRKA